MAFVSNFKINVLKEIHVFKCELRETYFVCVDQWMVRSSTVRQKCKTSICFKCLSRSIWWWHNLWWNLMQLLWYNQCHFYVMVSYCYNYMNVISHQLCFVLFHAPDNVINVDACYLIKERNGSAPIQKQIDLAKFRNLNQ